MPTRPILICLLVTLGPAFQPEPAPPADVAREVLLRQVPQSDADILARKELAQACLAELEKASRPQTDADDEAAAALRSARESLAGAWSAYADSLERLVALKANLARLTGEEHLRELTAELDQVESDTESLARSPAPLWATDEDVRAARSEHQALEARVTALAEAQSRRSAQLATGFQQQHDQLQDELGRLGQRGEELKTQLDTTLATTEGVAGEPLRTQLAQIEVRSATIELGLETLPLERQEAELTSQQTDQLLTAVRGKLDAVSRRSSALVDAKNRSQLEALELQRRRATAPVEVALLDLRILREKVLVHYFQRSEQISSLRKRYPDRDAERLKERLALSSAYWDRTVAALEYRSGDEVWDLQQELGEERRELTVYVSTIRDRLRQTLDESQSLQVTREKARRRFTELAERVTAEASAADTAERARLETDVASVRTGLEESMRLAVKEWEDVAGRISEAETLLRDHLTRLGDTDRRLHWRRVSSRDSGLLGADWSSARAELRAILFEPPKEQAQDSDAVARANFHRELFAGQREPGTEIRRLTSVVAREVRAASGADWGWSSVALILSIMVGVVLHRFGRRKGVRLARDIVAEGNQLQTEGPTPGSGLSARLNLLALNMLGDLVIPLFGAAALLFGTWQIVGAEAIRRLVAILLACLLGAAVLLRLVHHLFEAFSPPHRSIPCSDVVAKHYRWWLSGMVLLALVGLPAPLLLRFAGLAPALQNACLELYKAGFLLMLLLFIVRKGRVLGLGDVGELHWGVTMAWIAYPVAVIAVAALLVLQVIGFGVLVTFLGTGLLATVGVVFIVGAAAEYLVDVIDHHCRPAVPSSSRAGTNLDSETDKTGEIEAGRAYHIVALLNWFIRVVALVVAVLLILRAWDVPLRSEWLAWRMIGLGGLVVLLALVLDRIVSTAIFTLYRSGRLPNSTARMIRRWLRGILTIVVGLALIALAGFEIDSIWTFLTALLAMVAIGFVAVWSILSNIFATLVILIWRPFNIGEQIEILPEGLAGQVVDINFIYTILKSDQGSKVSVPNNIFAQKFIKRHSVRGAPKRTLAEQLESEQPLEE